MEVSATGKIVEWNDAKGYGFLRSGPKRFFVHIRDFTVRSGRPGKGDVVTFVPGRDEKGRSCATQIVQISTRGKMGIGGGMVLLVLLFLPVIVWCCLSANWYWLGGVFIAINLATYLTYAHDKRQAVAKGWRTPEATLHLMELFGGWAGAFFAQRRLRHKCSKVSYQFVFWLIVLLHQALAFDSLLDWRYTLRSISYLHSR